jgi:uncharacterized protein YgiM (DUF1202 family)
MERKMSVKRVGLVLLLVAATLLTACGMLGPVKIEPTTISIETINTLVSQTLAAQQALLPPTLEPLPPTETPPTPTITPTSTPSVPIITATIDTNCRVGADIYWDVVGAFKKDTEAVVIGMWLNGAWYLIKNPSNPALGNCWVWGNSIVRKGDWSRVPNINPPPTPTPGP